MALARGGLLVRGLLPLIVLAATPPRALGAEAPLQQVAPADPFRSSCQRLQALVEAAEKAMTEGDPARAAVRVEEAETLVADWVLEDLRRPEVTPLLDRLRALQAALPDAEAPQEPEPGLKVDEEVVNLTGEDLKAELDQVQKAEAGAHFDFPIDLNDKVLTWVRLFTTSRRGFIEGALARATQYLPMVRQVFQEEGIPLDLAYLAVIESGYKNTARSRAQAVGMWQFIRSTGRIYGLTGNAWVEERRDPIKSTRAAARYLRRLYEASGDWYLALVGYNAGPLTTERGIQGTGSRNFWDLARSRYLRNETKNYVPELCAAILVGRFPERYGLDVPQMTPYAYETVEVDRMTSLSVLARFAGTDVQVLKDLNPELVRATTPPGRYTLRVPPGLGGETQRALAAIPAGQRLDFKTYVIRKGDTLARVASRFAVTPEDLLATNGLRAAQFRPGRRIQVPPKSPVPISSRDLQSQEARDRRLGDRPLESIPRLPSPGPAASVPAGAPKEAVPSGGDIADREPISASVPPPQAPAPRVLKYRVRKGDTLARIAREHGVTPQQVRAWNGLRSDRIRDGQVLRLHVR